MTVASTDPLEHEHREQLNAGMNHHSYQLDNSDADYGCSETAPRDSHNVFFDSEPDMHEFVEFEQPSYDLSLWDPIHGLVVSNKESGWYDAEAGDTLNEADVNDWPGPSQSSFIDEAEFNNLTDVPIEHHDIDELDNSNILDAQEDEQYNSTDLIRKGSPTMSEYWRSLRIQKSLKMKLINKYIELHRQKGQIISRESATRRLKFRCNDETANHLISGDSDREQQAFRYLSFHLRSEKVFTLDELVRLRKALFTLHDISPTVAAKTISWGLKALPMKRKVWIHTSGEKDDKTIESLAEEVYQAFLEESRDRYQQSFNKPKTSSSSSYEPSDRAKRSAGIRSTSRYWIGLTDEDQCLLLEKYSALSQADPRTLWLRLSLRCDRRCAMLLRSDEQSYAESAVLLLDAPFRPLDDILTHEEKFVTFDYMERELGMKGTHRSYVYSIGVRFLADSIKESIRQENNKSPARLGEIGKFLHEIFKHQHRNKMRQQRLDKNASRRAV